MNDISYAGHLLFLIGNDSYELYGCGHNEEVQLSINSNDLCSSASFRFHGNNSKIVEPAIILKKNGNSSIFVGNASLIALCGCNIEISSHIFYKVPSSQSFFVLKQEKLENKHI